MVGDGDSVSTMTVATVIEVTVPRLDYDGNDGD